MGFLPAFPHAMRLDLGFTPPADEYWQSRVTVPLFETISLFPALRELHIFELWRDVSDCLTPRAPPPALHCLELHGLSLAPILTWLHASNHLPNVDSLKLASLKQSSVSGDCEFVRAAMQQIGSTLRHLDIDLKNPDSVYLSHAACYLIILWWFTK
ncbi:hypothetical protein C8R45DRAFT_1035163 [Mycena sanguinolenta]|nr:hypothetical protein C8R45DRAFT_1035163 [Mycena sanguinolenta]